MPTLEESLLKCKVDGCIVYLPPMSEGPLENYQEVRKALLNAGAKYKRNTFVFTNDAQPYIDRLVSGESVNIKNEYQFFPTPADIAAMMVSYLPPVADDAKVLEPSAGDGALVKAFHGAYPNITVDCCELMDINWKILQKMKGVNFITDDFISATDLKVNGFGLLGSYDIIIANPPFTKNQDIDHIRKMYECLKPGGTIITLASPSWTFGSNKKQVEFKQWLEDLDVFPKTLLQKSFASSGTNITPVLLQIKKPIEEVNNSRPWVDNKAIAKEIINDLCSDGNTEHRKPKEILEDIKATNKEIEQGVAQLEEMINDEEPVRKCRICGCTDNDCRRCIEFTGGPCHWVEEDLCSACVQLSFEGFRPILLKLQKEHSSLDHDWWKSRWHDWIDMKADDPEWNKKHQLELIWPKVWEFYKEQFCKSKVEENRDQSSQTLPPVENEASDVEENQTASPEVVPDAYQEYLDKRNSSSITFTEMKFFEQLQKAAQGVDLTLSIKEKNGKFTVMVLPKASDQSKIQPLIVTGTPEELDQDFFPKVGPVILESTTLLINADEYKKSIADAAKTKDNKSTPATPSADSKPKPKGPAAAGAKKKAEKKGAAKKQAAKKNDKQQTKKEETPKVVEQALF